MTARDGLNDSFTVAEAVRMSGQSEATVRRHLKTKLVAIEGGRPTRITGESLRSWCDELLRRAPKPLEGADAPSIPLDQVVAQLTELQRRLTAVEHANAMAASENQRLAKENEQLRRTVQSLRQAHVILTDELGTYTTPNIPNN